LVGSFHQGTVAAYPDIELHSLVVIFARVGWARVCPFKTQPISEFKLDAMGVGGDRRACAEAKPNVENPEPRTRLVRGSVLGRVLSGRLQSLSMM
jgi:hypothetical protein